MNLLTTLKSTIAAMLAVVGMVATVHAQEGRPRGPQVASPEVREDGKVVFRLQAPGAESVRLVSPDLGNLEATGRFNKNDEGLWQLEYGPIKPARALRYKFEVDGVQMVDPTNRETSEANGTVFSMVFVPGLKWMELQDVPHGAVSEVVYHSNVLNRFRRMHVYTPPGYESGNETYPVFYLLHGATDSDDSWSTVGRANVILDNLIAAGQAVPMVVVMPDGHVSQMGRGRGGFQMEEFVNEFTNDIVPHVRKSYRVHTDRSKTAIAGLSMGGAQTLGVIGKDLAGYGYVGVFSSGIFGINREPANGPSWEEQHLGVLKNADLKDGLQLLWFATGRDDFLIETSRDTVALFKKHDFDVVYEETDGGHTWVNWRDYLHQFAPMLFQAETESTVTGGDGETTPESAEIKIIRDIAYREGDSKAWRLDLAMPAGRGGELRPALVIVHGGGWAGGSRTVDVFQKMMTDYAKKGYVTVNIDYRLTGEAPFPACIEDVKCAVRWLRAHAGEYGIDPDRIGAYGHSAGAHLALMLAMAPKSAGLEGDGGWDEHSSLVNAVVGGSPPTELGRDVPMAKKEWWPIGYISGDHPPMFLIQGGADRIVRAELTEDFLEKMKAESADIEYLKIEGGQHGVAYAEALDVTDPAIEKFFAKHLKPVTPKLQRTSEVQEEAKSPYVVIENGGTGPHPAVATEVWTLPGMTIFRPRDLSPFGAGKKLPIVVWGNGACANTTQEHKNFLNELASNGYVIVAIGLLDQIEKRGEASRQKTDASQLLKGLDWILAENQSTESIYFGKVDSTKVASMGMSCGGLQAIQISADPRITTTVVCNSGVLPEPSPMPGMPSLSKDVLKHFHGPVLYLMGGPSDIAYKNAMDDFQRVNHVPIVMTNLDVGHAGTYARPHGGEYTPVALAWLDWQLKDRQEASKMFLGEDSELNRDPKWTIETRNFGR
jgi:enterochelin esterase-like enzyme/dienelactone hydrolase